MKCFKLFFFPIQSFWHNYKSIFTPICKKFPDIFIQLSGDQTFFFSFNLLTNVVYFELQLTFKFMVPFLYHSPKNDSYFDSIYSKIYYFNQKIKKFGTSLEYEKKKMQVLQMKILSQSCQKTASSGVKTALCAN